jgi:hypothetical protein
MMLKKKVVFSKGGIEGSVGRLLGCSVARLIDEIDLGYI